MHASVQRREVTTRRKEWVVTDPSDPSIGIPANELAVVMQWARQALDDAGQRGDAVMVRGAEDGAVIVSIVVASTSTVDG